MDTDTVIKVEHVSKKFSRDLRRSLLLGTTDLIRNLIGNPADTSTLRKSEFWALDDVSFEIKKGEKVGIIGSNGSGKSTLLRLLSGILPPDKGRIEVHGNIGSLIAVGAGFHPHMTGEENIYLNAAILGASTKLIEEKFDEIVEFAEIGEFIKAPVSTYSSGMRVRLGFSIAIHVLPKILLVDEILAVGDLAFRLKASKKLADFRNEEGTFILVSHNLAMMRNSCDRAIWLEKGKILMDGNAIDVCNAFESESINQVQESEEKSIINLDPGISIKNFRFLNNKSEVINSVESNEGIYAEMEIHNNRPIQKPFLSFTLLDVGESTIVFETYLDTNITELKPGINKIKLSIPSLNINAANLTCTITLSEKEILNKLEWHNRAYNLTVVDHNKYEYNKVGIVNLDHKWEILNV